MGRGRGGGGVWGDGGGEGRRKDKIQERIQEETLAGLCDSTTESKNPRTS